MRGESEGRGGGRDQLELKALIKYCVQGCEVVDLLLGKS
jgi:hypothetical protein